MSEYANTVREALLDAEDPVLRVERDEGQGWAIAFAALDGLVAELERLARERDEEHELSLGRYKAHVAEVELRQAAEAELAEAIRWHSAELREREAAEAQVATLRDALEQIWRMHDIPIGGESHSAAMREVARAALKAGA